MKIRKIKKQPSQLDLMKEIRRPMPPPSKVHPNPKGYDRKDKSWQKGD